MPGMDSLHEAEPLFERTPVRILYLNDHRVRSIRASHPLLAGKKVIARGSRAAVFEGRASNRVLKLMADPPGHMYLTDGCAPKGPHVPIVYEDFGEVGQTYTGHSLYLVELERLQARPRGYRLSPVLNKAYKLAHENYRETDYVEPRLPDIDDSPEWLPQSLAEFFTQLNWFVSNAQVRLDFKLGHNYMVRSNGELVASDPVFDPRAPVHNSGAGPFAH